MQVKLIGNVYWLLLLIIVHMLYIYTELPWLCGGNPGKCQHQDKPGQQPLSFSPSPISIEEGTDAEYVSQLMNACLLLTNESHHYIIYNIYIYTV